MSSNCFLLREFKESRRIVMIKFDPQIDQFDLQMWQIDVFIIHSPVTFT